MKEKLLCLLLTVVANVSPALAQTNYSGNGGTSFGGAIGQGSLSLSSDGTTITGTLTKGVSGNFNDVFVIYIDSTAGGFSDTSTFADGQDGLRKAISGFDGGTNRSLLTMPSLFQADFALALGPASDSFGGLFQLAAGGNNSLNFVTSANLTPLTNSSATYTFSISVASLGLTPNTASTFKFFGTYISNTGYRSNESIGTTLSGTPQDGNGNFGYSPVSTAGFATFTIVPEPSTVALLIASGALLAGRCFKQRRRS